MTDTMRIEELFARDVTRDIPPVVYFHEQSPEKLAAEVDEYIVTGGYPESDPRHARVRRGIHEELVRLLRNLHSERTKRGGPELPASWISGFYGSGKSSFAKLLGLALDHRTLLDGRTLEDAFLARDQSPLSPELREAWAALVKDIEPVAVVFDIGSSARDQEHIHAVVVRELQRRLGYCDKSEDVAEFELALERDGEYEAFLHQAQKTLGAPWDVMKSKNQADDHFSHVLHDMRPDRYPVPTEWLDTHAGKRRGRGLSVQEAVDLIEAMLDIRAEAKTLFLVVDEVSQYVHDSQDRMLKLQSFVSALGQRLKGRVWLLVTGQQKLDEAAESTVLGKLKDRFPDRLRVHLSTTNIRDVVHRRLLAKKPDKELALEALFQRYRSELKLYGYHCEEITQADFIEVYPMLPGHIDLVLQITTNLRARSTRMQGDSHAIRGLLQLLGEVFRQRELATKEIGTLLTIEDVYEVLQTALDSDVQSSMEQILQHCADKNDSVAAEAARAVAMLELVQERLPTTAELVAQCLYRKLGQPSRVTELAEALERLRSASLLSYSEKQGYRIQSSAGQEWAKERSDIAAGAEKVSEVVQRAAADLLADVERARLGSRAFDYYPLFSDRLVQEQLIGKRTRDDAVVTIDLRYATNAEERRSEAWVRRSGEDALADRIVWITGDPGRTEDLARLLVKARGMVNRYGARKESLSPEKQRLLLEEQALVEEHESKLRHALADAFHAGTVYFRSQPLTPRDLGGSFSTALAALAAKLLPALYQHFEDVAITETELGQLLEKDLHGPSPKFFEKGLGILSVESGRAEPTCRGTVPQRVLAHIQKKNGLAGEHLLKDFLSPPYGYAPDVVKACVAGLLRMGALKIIPDGAPEITSVRDPGVRDLFRRDRDFKRAELFHHDGGGLTPRDRTAICKLFSQALRVDLERDNDHIAEAVFERFPKERERLRELEARFNRLPNRPELPEALRKLGRALEDCRASRHVEKTVEAVKRNLDTLRDGFAQLAVLHVELTDAGLATLEDAASARDHELAQLQAIGAVADLEDAVTTLSVRFDSDRPWRDLGDLGDTVARIRQAYAAKRRDILGQQEQACEAARAEVKARDGFAKLSPDQAHRVLRPIAEAAYDTSETAVAPTLATLLHTFPRRLEEATDEANDRLSAELEKAGGPQIVKVALDLRGRELTSEAQLEALLREIEDRLRAQLKQGRRVRLT
jgi:hypothetical protein